MIFYKHLRLGLTFIFSVCFVGISSAQIAISEDGSAPENSSMLHVKSVNKGFLTPRMSTIQRTTINTPANGLLVFDSTSNSFWFYKTGLGWKEITSSNWLPHINGIYYPSPKNVGIRTEPVPGVSLTVLGDPGGPASNPALFTSNHTWHTAVAFKNNTSQFTFIVAGPNDIELQPKNFGIFNNNTARWPFTIGAQNNNIGIGNPTPYPVTAKSTLHVFSGDVNIEQIGSGIIIKSPNGQCWRVTVDNTGTLSSAYITCP